MAQHPSRTELDIKEDASNALMLFLLSDCFKKIVLSSSSPSGNFNCHQEIDGLVLALRAALKELDTIADIISDDLSRKIMKLTRILKEDFEVSFESILSFIKIMAGSRFAHIYSVFNIE